MDRGYTAGILALRAYLINRARERESPDEGRFGLSFDQRLDFSRSRETLDRFIAVSNQIEGQGERHAASLELGTGFGDGWLVGPPVREKRVFRRLDPVSRWGSLERRFRIQAAGVLAGIPGTCLAHGDRWEWLVSTDHCG